MPECIVLARDAILKEARNYPTDYAKLRGRSFLDIFHEMYGDPMAIITDPYTETIDLLGMFVSCQEIYELECSVRVRWGWGESPSETGVPH